MKIACSVLAFGGSLLLASWPSEVIAHSTTTAAGQKASHETGGGGVAVRVAAAVTAAAVGHVSSNAGEAIEVAQDLPACCTEIGVGGQGFVGGGETVYYCEDQDWESENRLPYDYDDDSDIDYDDLQDFLEDSAACYAGPVPNDHLFEQICWFLSNPFTPSTANCNLVIAGVASVLDRPLLPHEKEMLVACGACSGDETVAIDPPGGELPMMIGEDRSPRCFLGGNCGGSVGPPPQAIGGDPYYTPPPAYSPGGDEKLIPPMSTGTLTSWPEGTQFDHQIDLPPAKLIGQDFGIGRNYSSEPSLGGPGLIGTNWSANVFERLEVDPATPPATAPVLMISEGSQALGMYLPDDDMSPSFWAKEKGPSTEIIWQDTITIDSTTFDVWRFGEPGGCQIDYYRAGGANSANTPADYEGLILQQRDTYGNPSTYEYEDYGPVGYEQPRLKNIYLNGTDSTDAAGTVTFGWMLTGGSSAIHGKLDYFVATRSVGAEDVVTNFADYIYGEEISGLPDDVGDAGDLVMVIQGTATDQAAAATPIVGGPMYLQVTQYRYHDNSTPEDEDERLEAKGLEGQLKMIIKPEQIEFYAQHRNNGGGFAAADEALLKAAYELLTLDDDEEAVMDAPIPVDMASKIVSYYTTGGDTGKVHRQYIQTSCGCSANTQGLKLEYTYGSTMSGPTTKVVESTGAGYSTTNRTIYYDMEYPQGAPRPTS